MRALVSFVLFLSGVSRVALARAAPSLRSAPICTLAVRQSFETLYFPLKPRMQKNKLFSIFFFWGRAAICFLHARRLPSRCSKRAPVSPTCTLSGVVQLGLCLAVNTWICDCFLPPIRLTTCHLTFVSFLVCLKENICLFLLFYVETWPHLCRLLHFFSACVLSLLATPICQPRCHHHHTDWHRCGRRRARWWTLFASRPIVAATRPPGCRK